MLGHANDTVHLSMYESRSAIYGYCCGAAFQDVLSLTVQMIT